MIWFWIFWLLVAFVVGVTVAYELVEDIPRVSSFMCLIFCVVLVATSVCGSISSGYKQENEQKCALFGYSDAVTYKGDWFCVGYVNQEPHFVAVTEIDGWEE